MTEINTHIVVSADHPSLAGHFPGRPVVPGVVLLDNVFEALRGSLSRPIELVTVVSAKFLQAIDPGVAIDIHVTLSDEPSGRIKARFTGTRATARVLEGSFLLHASSAGSAR